MTGIFLDAQFEGPGAPEECWRATARLAGGSFGIGVARERREAERLAIADLDARLAGARKNPRRTRRFSLLSRS